MKVMHSLVFAAAASVALAAGITTGAAYADDQKKQQRTTAASCPAHERLEKKDRQLMGTVVSTKEVEVKRTNTKNLVALIQPQKGKRDRIVADLGPTSALGDIKKGDTIKAKGRVVSIGDRAVFVATKLKTDKGGTMDIKRAAQDKQAQSEQQGKQTQPKSKAKQAPEQNPNQNK